MRLAGLSRSDVDQREHRGESTVDEGAIYEEVYVVEPVPHVAMPVKTGNPSKATEMITMLTGTLQGMVKPLAQTPPTTNAPPYASRLICWRCSPPARRSRTMSETADATMELAATMLPAPPTIPKTELPTPYGVVICAERYDRRYEAKQ